MGELGPILYKQYKCMIYKVDFTSLKARNMKSKKIESEARRISIGLVKDVLENIFDSCEIETTNTGNAEEPPSDSNKRKCEEELVISSRTTRSRKTQKVEKNSGVFLPSDPSSASVPVAEIPRLGSRIKLDNTAALAESNKAILDSLPVLEKLRSLSRTGSVKDEGSVSEVGDISDKDSVASGAISKSSKKNKNGKKSTGKSNGKNKKVNTRSSKGKGRRTILKKKPVKSISANATATTSERVYFKGQFYSKGDIVSVVNAGDDDTYYAQLRGFLTDQYSDKYGVITWLLPTTSSPPPNEGFHPATYILGPEEDLPRNLEVFSFVMRAPDDYFYNRRAPYKTDNIPEDSNFTSVRLGPRLRKNVDGKDIFVGLY